MVECQDEVLKEIRCIVCPTGCNIQVKRNEEGEITYDGYTCKRGLDYAKQEFLAPKRVLTTTMRVKNGFLPLVPVRTDIAILKEKLNDALEEIAVKVIEAPIKVGQVLIENVAGSDGNIIASRDLGTAS